MATKIRVLMVDDEAQFRKTTRKILSKKGFEAILAASGEEALEQLSEHPDVVVLDIKMPGMNGHQVLKEIRRRNPELPVIMLTGHGSRPSAREARVAGAFDYLSKPCDINLLAAKIKEAYGYAQQPGSAEEKSLGEVMVPISEYTVLTGEEILAEALVKLKTSFTSRLSTSRIMETGHRSILVMDGQENVRGTLTIRDLLACFLPPYLSAPKPATGDSIQYSPMFWKGMFAKAVQDNRGVKIKEIMSPTPRTIESQANLMEAAYMMKKFNARRLMVISAGKVAGIVREQDLFFEITRIMSAGDS